MIDVERLKTDPDYWDEVAPEGATHYREDLFYRVTGDDVLFFTDTNLIRSASYALEEITVDDLIARPTKTPEAEWFEIGSKWEHYSGKVYSIVGVANGNTEKPDQYPVTVIYQNVDNGTLWARPIEDWGRSFKPYRTKVQRLTGEFAQALIDDLSVIDINLDHDMAIAAAIGFINRGWTKEPKS